MADEKDKAPVAFGDPATEPVDLAEAFKRYEQANRATADVPVDTGEEAEQTNGVEGSDGAGYTNQADGIQQTADTSDELQAGDNSFGGSTNVVEPIDFDARRQELLKDIQRQAVEKVRQDFTNNGIKTCSIEDLYQRDENTGRVTFKNPDNPQRDFESRAEAQAWVDAFNKQLQNRFTQDINRAQRDLMAQNGPQLRVIAFAPKYEAMSQIEKDILDDLLDGHAIHDAGGNVVGFNVDLNAAAAQAKKIAKRYPVQQEQQAEPQEEAKKASGPAMDLPTGTGKSAEVKEPETLAEAMKMYNDSKKKGK